MCSEVPEDAVSDGGSPVSLGKSPPPHPAPSLHHVPPPCRLSCLPDRSGLTHPDSSDRTWHRARTDGGLQDMLATRGKPRRQARVPPESVLEPTTTRTSAPSSLSDACRAHCLLRGGGERQRAPYVSIQGECGICCARTAADLRDVISEWRRNAAWPGLMGCGTF